MSPTSLASSSLAFSLLPQGGLLGLLLLRDFVEEKDADRACPPEVGPSALLVYLFSWDGSRACKRTSAGLLEVEVRGQPLMLAFYLSPSLKHGFLFATV